MNKRVTEPTMSVALTSLSLTGYPSPGLPPPLTWTHQLG